MNLRETVDSILRDSSINVKSDGFRVDANSEPFVIVTPYGKDYSVYVNIFTPIRFCINRHSQLSIDVVNILCDRVVPGIGVIKGGYKADAENITCFFKSALTFYV